MHDSNLPCNFGRGWWKIAFFHYLCTSVRKYRRMQYKLVSTCGSDRLVLFFAGWAMDAHPFETLRRDGYDVMVVWDYRYFDIDWSCVDSYREICIIAWSMGVYAADMSTHSISSRVSKRIAVNGTTSPVHNMLGIPEAVFSGTRKGLTANSLRKFYRRVCGSREVFAAFSEHLPERDLDELGDELDAIWPAPLLTNSPAGSWDLAFISRDDAIFPAVNQWRAWHDRVPVVMTDGPHYPDIQKIIDRQIVDKQIIAPRFGRGQATYDSEASVQREIVDRLFKAALALGVGPTAATPGAKILEIGCGTGLLSHRISDIMTPGAYLEMWDVVDVSPLQGTDRRFRCCDAEIAVRGLVSRSFDLIASASTVQWFNSPRRFLAECCRVLKEGGLLLCSTFVSGNIAEVSSLTGNALPLLSAGQWRMIIPEGFEILLFETYSRDMAFDSALDVFRHLKATGVNALGRSAAGEVSLRPLLERYQPDLDGRYHITYRPLIFILKKRYGTGF